MVGGLIAFAGGVLVSLIGFLISGAAIKRGNNNALTYVSPVRMILYVAYFAAMYLLSGYLQWGSIPLFVGGALGIVISMIIFTKLLINMINKQKNDKKPEDSGGKDDGDGIV